MRIPSHSKPACISNHLSTAARAEQARPRDAAAPRTGQADPRPVERVASHYTIRKSTRAVTAMISFFWGSLTRMRPGP